jgi:hypothetical protein
VADGWEAATRSSVYRAQKLLLPTPEDRLLFILAYRKTDTLQVVQGRLLGMVHGKANQDNARTPHYLLLQHLYR